MSCTELHERRLSAHTAPTEPHALPGSWTFPFSETTYPFSLEEHLVFDCPDVAHVPRHFRSLYQDADGTMQCFVWHKDQKAVCHCLTAILSPSLS